MENLIKLFEDNSKKAMSESESAIKERNWVKSERKEIEAQTWQEAARLLKKHQHEIEQPKITSQKIRDQKIEAFVKKHETIIGDAILHDKDQLKREIGDLARTEIGYSSTTWNLDIFRTIKLAYERFVMSA